MIRMSGRAALVAALVAVLTLVGGGGAVAYWSVSAQVEAAAATASVGLSQTVHPSVETTPLKVTYSSSNLTAAGAVTVVNTGTREADYSITLAPQSPTAPGLPGAITVAVAQVVSVDACTPTTALTAPQTGTLSSTPGFTAHGAVDAGGTIFLCVQTSLSAAGATAYANASTGVSMTTELEYAPLDEWMLDTSFSFTQSVGSSLLFFTDSSARYKIYNDGRCVLKHGSDMLGRGSGSDCNYAEGEWRIAPLSDGTFVIGRAQNGNPLTAPQWTAVAPAADATTLLRNASGQSEQRWRISSASGSGYTFESVRYPGTCLTVGEGLWYGPNLGEARKIVLSNCNGSAAQVFAIDQIGDPLGEPEVMTCSGSGSYLGLQFPRDELYYQETVHRVFFAHADSPSNRVPYAYTVNPGSPQVQLYASDSALSTALNAVGTGRVWIYVQAQIAGGSWHDAGVGQIRTTGSGSSLSLMCGWQ